jgi:hypothetical protein
MTDQLPALNNPPTNLPFAPHPTESLKAFDAFLCYVDMGRNRSWRQVAAKVGVSVDSIKLWSGKYHWVERVHQYQAHILRSRLEVETAAIKATAETWAKRHDEFREREWNVGAKLLAVAHRCLDALATKDPDDATLAEVSRAIDVADRIARLSLDLATINAHLNADINATVRIEAQTALDKIYGEPIPGEIVDVQEPPENSSPAPNDQPKQLPQ